MPQFTIFLANNDHLTRITHSRSTRYWIKAEDATRACHLAKACFVADSKNLTNDLEEHAPEIVCVLEGFLSGELREAGNPEIFNAATRDDLETLILAQRISNVIEKYETEDEGLLLLQCGTVASWQVHLLTRMKSGWQATILQDFSDQAMAAYVFRIARSKLELLTDQTELFPSLVAMTSLMAAQPFPMVVVEQFQLPDKSVIHYRLKNQPESHHLFECVKTGHGWYGQRLAGPHSEKTIRYAFWNHIMYPFLLALYGLDPQDNAGPESTGFFNSEIVSLLTRRARFMPEYEELVSGALANFEPLIFPLSYPPWFMDLWFGNQRSGQAAGYRLLWNRLEAAMRQFLWDAETNRNEENPPLAADGGPFRIGDPDTS